MTKIYVIFAGQNASEQVIRTIRTSSDFSVRRYLLYLELSNSKAHVKDIISYLGTRHVLIKTWQLKFHT